MQQQENEQLWSRLFDKLELIGYLQQNDFFDFFDLNLGLRLEELVELDAPSLTRLINAARSKKAGQ